MAVGFGTGGGTGIFGFAHGTASPQDSSLGSIISGDGTSQLLVAFLAYDTGITISSVVFDPAGVNTALTSLGSVVNGAGQKDEIWGLLGPSNVATVPIRATFTG